ncbi:MAG: hypothetical protein ACEQSB_07275 [Undibacterium sp.]
MAKRDTGSEYLTVRFKVVDKEAAAPLWDAMRRGAPPILGLSPNAMAWGDLFQEKDLLEDVVAILEQHVMEDVSNWPCADQDLPMVVETLCGKQFFQQPAGNYSSLEEGTVCSVEAFKSLAELEEHYGKTIVAEE